MTGGGLAAVILAAGAGTRLGGVAKALLRHGERTYLETIVATAREVGLVDAVVVLGPPFGDAIRPQAEALGLRVIVNSEPARGMASSIALGFAALEAGPAGAAWLWPVDHPRVAAATLHRLLEARGAHDVAQPTCDGRGGHPPLIVRALWPRLAGCGDAAGGARSVLAASDLVRVEVADPGVIRDVDVPGDLEGDRGHA